MRHGVYPILDKHDGRRNQGTWASNPNDISQETNGKQRQADACFTTMIKLVYSAYFLKSNPLSVIKYYTYILLSY